MGLYLREGAALAGLFVVLGLWAIFGHALLCPDTSAEVVPFGIIMTGDRP